MSAVVEYILSPFLPKNSALVVSTVQNSHVNLNEIYLNDGNIEKKTSSCVQITCIRNISDLHN